MADIASSLTKLNDIEIAFEAALSEALFDKIGGSINGLIDAVGSNYPLGGSSIKTRLDALESYQSSSSSDISDLKGASYATASYSDVTFNSSGSSFGPIASLTQAGTGGMFFATFEKQVDVEAGGLFLDANNFACEMYPILRYRVNGGAWSDQYRGRKFIIPAGWESGNVNYSDSVPTSLGGARTDATNFGWSLFTSIYSNPGGTATHDVQFGFYLSRTGISARILDMVLVLTQVIVKT